MKNSWYIRKLGLVFLLLMTMPFCFQSCWIRKQKPKENIEQKDTVWVTKLNPEQLLKQKIHYYFWSGKVNADYDDGNIAQATELLIQSVYNSQSFLSARAGGFGITMEVAAGLADPDSIKAINKLEASYYLYSIDEAQKLIGAPLSFSQLQNLLVGNPLFDTGRIVAFDTLINGINLVSEQDGYLQSLFFEKNTNALKEIKIVNETKQFEATISLSDYRWVDNKVFFPYHREIIIHLGERQTTMILDFTQVDFVNPFKIQFKIPRTYRLIR